MFNPINRKFTNTTDNFYIFLSKNTNPHFASYIAMHSSSYFASENIWMLLKFIMTVSNRMYDEIIFLIY